MHAVFAKTLVEGKTVNIKFGDAQKITLDLCNFHKGGAMTHVSTAMLESWLTKLQLNKMWTKTVSAFATAVLHLIQDHKEATQGIHTDNYDIKKLNATFFERKMMEMQDAMLLRRSHSKRKRAMTVTLWAIRWTCANI